MHHIENNAIPAGKFCLPHKETISAERLVIALPSKHCSVLVIVVVVVVDSTKPHRKKATEEHMEAGAQK